MEGMERKWVNAWIFGVGTCDKHRPDQFHLLLEIIQHTANITGKDNREQKR